MIPKAARVLDMIIIPRFCLRGTQGEHARQKGWPPGAENVTVSSQENEKLGFTVGVF